MDIQKESEHVVTKVAVSKWGNSTAIRLPKAVVEQLGLKQGELVEMSVENGRGIFEVVPSGPRKITLEWIAAEMKRLGASHAPSEVDWGDDQGEEVIHDDYS